MRGARKHSRRLRCRTKRLVAAFTKLFAECSRTISSSETEKSPIIIPTRRRRGMRVRAIPTAHRGHTKMPCKTRRFSKRTGRIISKVLTLCELCAVLTHACRVACICILDREKFFKKCIRQRLCWAWPKNKVQPYDTRNPSCSRRNLRYRTRTQFARSQREARQGKSGSARRTRYYRI